MRNFVKSALFSALLLLTLTGTDIKAGPLLGGLSAGMVLGAGAVWGWAFGPESPLIDAPLNIVKLDPSAPDSVKSVANKIKTVAYACSVAKIAAVVGWIGTALPTL